MLTICRTTIVRICVKPYAIICRRGRVNNDKYSKRRLWTTSPGQHHHQKQDSHIGLPKSPEHHTSSTSTSLVDDQVPPDSTPVQYAPASPPPSSYQIPAEALQNAKAKESFWSYNMYKHISTGKTPLRHYCKTREQCETVAKLFLADGAQYLGFDMEWAPPGRPGSDPGVEAKRNVSMIQLASESRIAIFHIALHTESTPLALIPPTSSLAHLLTSRSITKLGVAISADMMRLQKHFPHLTPHAYFELSHLYKTITYQDDPAQLNKRLVSLADLAQAVFGLRLNKDQEIRAGEWGRPASLLQVEYAASDAYAGVMLFVEMERRRQRLVPVPRMPAFVEFGRGLGLGEYGGGEKRVKVRKLPVREKESDIVVGKQGEGKGEESEDGKHVDVFVMDELHNSNYAEVGMLEEEITEWSFGERGNSMSKKPKGLAGREPKARDNVPSRSAKAEKVERTSAEKSVALARRNAFVQNLYQQKLKK